MTRRRLSEAAGGTAAECTAVLCCCPCALLNLLVLAVYKLPAAAFRRVLCRRRRKALPPPRNFAKNEGREAMPVKSLQCDKDVMMLEKEMWDRFERTGFWRSLSCRDKLTDDHES